MSTQSRLTHRIQILIFDEEVALAEALAYTLLKSGYQPLIASCREECLDMMRTARPDLVLLDILLPVEDGFAFCREICRIRDVPLIMLTTQASEADCISGLELCADDYIVKPFSMAVLLARIKSVLRRIKQSRLPSLPPITRGDFVTIPEKSQIIVRGQIITLAFQEFKVLHFLMTHPGAVLSREEIIQQVWGNTLDRGVTLPCVDVYMRPLRQRIEINPSQPRHIITIFRRGYQFSFNDKESSLP